MGLRRRSEMRDGPVFLGMPRIRSWISGASRSGTRGTVAEDVVSQYVWYVRYVDAPVRADGHCEGRLSDGVVGPVRRERYAVPGGASPAPARGVPAG